MDIYQIIAVAVMLLGGCITIIKSYIGLSETQKEHSKSIQKQMEMTEVLFDKINAIPRIDLETLVTKQMCETKGMEIISIKNDISSITNTLAHLENNFASHSKEISKEIMRFGNYMAKLETILDERTEKRISK